VDTDIPAARPRGIPWGGSIVLLTASQIFVGAFVLFLAAIGLMIGWAT